MRIVVVKFISLILLTTTSLSSGSDCPGNWFDCGNGKCIAAIWYCDGDNDCGNLRDEHDCEPSPSQVMCLSSQFECESDKHCIPERWHCDGEKDCDDGSDEIRCDNVTEECTGFVCRNHHCIPTKWHCDGHADCTDGSDEELCSHGKLCTDSEFLCSSGSCINQSLVCDQKKDCMDGSDEGLHCGDPCENATCSQNCRSTPAGPQCYCNDGYILDTKDNRTCSDIDECLQDGFCSHQCTNTNGSYNCSCRSGYELVNRTCKARGADPLLVFTTLQEIRAMHLRSGQYFLIRRAIYKASAVDVDPKSQQIYWIEVSNKSSVYSAKIDGSNFRTILSHGLLVPEDIAVDYVANNLYLTDSRLRQVLACKMDGTMCSVLHDKNVGKPRSIVLDPAEGFLYWSDWGEQTSGIYRSGMDGSRRIPLVSSSIAWPNGIAIDHSTNRLYWADAKLNTIEYISLDGSSRKVILNATVFHPYSLSVFEDTIYWTDWSTFSLESCNKFTGHKMTLLARENGRHIMGVHVYHPVLTATAPNPCWSNDCSHMCLISPTSGFSCACPHGFQLGRDGKTCTMEENSASIFVSEGSSIFYIRPRAVGSETITELPLPLSTAIISRVSYDRNLRCLFVADINSPAIHAVNMTSLHMRVLVRSHIAVPEDLSFDWKSNNLYWIDSGKGIVEVISVDSLKRAVIIENLSKPVALAIAPESGLMFVATVGMQASVNMFGMDGKNGGLLHSVQGLPMSLALHPSRSILYWADPRSGTISYVDYKTSRSSRILTSRIDGVMSVAASEEYVYWTARKRELSLIKGNITHILQLPGQERGTVIRKVTYNPGIMTSAKSECLIGNGGCSYLCLTSPNGRTCSCPSEMMLADDNVTCIARQCEANEFKCMNGRCLPPDLRCDGNRDCEDGSDEIGCSNRCSGDDFQCKNGHCILKSWRCDRRNDCVDNSDEEDCPTAAACTEEQMSCLNGECVPVLWRCDGDQDCADGTDEVNCNVTRCDSDSHYRCDSGQCIPVSWVCDGSADCYDNSDEKNCSKTKTCKPHEFKCESDESCIDEMLKCDGRLDCSDGSDEKNCPLSHSSCKNGMYRCRDGACIYDYEVCDGHNDCSNNEEELNCTQTMCQPEELLCPSSKRCILRRWICDGDPDCSDGSDEENCVESKTQQPKQTSQAIDSTCDNFYCYETGQCLPWSKVCDGSQDCENLPDEGGLCSKACSAENGGCSHICRKTPYGSQCLCDKGYGLLPDNKTCDDVDECSVLGTCSHYCNNTRGGFKCSCAEGYVLHNNHRLCKADGPPATLVYLLGDKIRGFDLHSHNQHVIVDVKDADMTGMDYDISAGVFFWTERNDGSINIYSPETNKRVVIARSSLRPAYIRYDWITENLYLKDESSSIVVCDKEGRFCKTLIKPDRTSIDSLDISPTTGLMFWTVWANARRNQYSGLIERAEMDGSHRLVIVSKTNSPTAITVDHVLSMLYWTDKQLNTLECADFYGFSRRQIIQSDMYHPLAVAVFEDNVYWADWGSDSIIRCNKFTGRQDCEKIMEDNVKAHILLIVHKAMRPQGLNRCLDSNCSQLCLITRSSYACACDDLEDDGTCGLGTTPTSMSVVKCPKDHCQGDAQCIVKDGEYICQCSPPYSGKTCDVKAAASNTKYHYSWVVAVLLAIVVTGIIILAILMCVRNREKLHRVGESVSVKFLNPKSGRDGRLVMDTDDGNVYDELVLGQEGDYRQDHGNSDYTPSDTEEGDLKKWPPYGCDSLKFNNSIVNFFRKLKLNASML